MHICRAIAQAALGGRARRFSTPAYDIFKRIKDSNDSESGAADGAEDGGRKPSDKVIRLVDEILNLTLIESADLCDLCQQRLAGPFFKSTVMPGRTPFPHPHLLFSVPPEGQGMPIPEAPAAEAPPTTKASQPKQPAKKTTGSITLVGFDSAKKIAVIKIVRTVTGLGLRESKELVEKVPHILKKDIPIEDAENFVKEIEAAGGTVKLE
ncbi:39S ribosomal protein L12 like protein [Babesia gibsoni]|uniref:39S ribosomal protein L12 like protein n=1 Tax=Babesia gibsoni TaxID=33632 RepID=A0AAD8LRG1_BABGI|nr:39S ribosomal protein L12 like protein [Babesia gibsoni]